MQDDRPWTTSVTFSHSTESHAGGPVHGRVAKRGYTESEMRAARQWAGSRGLRSDWYELGALSGTGRTARVLVIRDGVRSLLHEAGLAADAAKVDFVRGIYPRLDRRFVNFMKMTVKKARGNAELADEAVPSRLKQVPIGTRVTSAQKRELNGEIVAFDTVPAFRALREGLPTILGPHATRLYGEVNYYGSTPEAPAADYYKDMGIGPHGDSERPDIVAVVLGNVAKELHFHGYRGTTPVGSRVIVRVHDGDMYVMDSDACGHEWVRERRRTDVIHYRHAAGPLGGNRFTRFRKRSGRGPRASGAT